MKKAVKKPTKTTIKMNDKGSKARKSAPKRSWLTKSSKGMSLYSSMVYRSRMKADQNARRKAEELAKLPKDPVKRFFARLHPKRVFKELFSKNGLKKVLKFGAACILLLIILIGGLFLYYKKDLDAVKLDELKVSETVNTYLDRNGKVLWEDKGDGDYRLVAEGKNISTYMRQATVAIEDKNFYNHPGVDFTALVRATLSTLTGRGVQGGSTLTQQLIKQVYFSDEASNRSISGIPRKIKEVILALEVEKMYDKEQLITMYLNESPYGGRRNGVESGAQTYFGKSAKDLNLAESALLASIPNNPGVLNPYNEYGNKALVARQHKTLNMMVDMGYITEKEAEKAKKVPILDQIKPEVSQYKNIKAPHFVLEVKRELEKKYGVKTMRAGGFVIKTTLDYKAQKLAEEAVAAGAEMMSRNGSDNIALSSVDVETGQIIAMVGSVDWHKPVYGETNAATSLLEPGSSIKPVLDYAPLFKQREGQNFGPGSVLKDESIDHIYCNGYVGSCQLRNYTGRFYGGVTIRQSLASSLNIPAVKALYINGVKDSMKTLHSLGDKSYCKDNLSAGLASGIGSGCSVRQTEHANTYASLARGGVYKPLAYILEVKNSSGDVLESWKNKEGKRVLDEQTAYMVSDILGDPAARTLVFGAQAYAFGFKIPGVWTASKTGTTTTANSAVSKDSWLMSYSPVVATGVWNGNHDGRGLASSDNSLVRRVMHNYMEGVHKQVYGPAGKWTENQKITKPSGIKTMSVGGRTDIWPSWYNTKTSGVTKETKTFNKFTKTLAADCTPEAYRVEVEVSKFIDPMTKKETLNVPDGYNQDTTDTCNYAPPSVSISRGADGVTVTVKRGTADYSYTVIAGDRTIKSGNNIGADLNLFIPIDELSDVKTKKVVITATDVSGSLSDSDSTTL